MGDLVVYLVVTQGLNDPAEPRGEDVLVPNLDGMIERPRRPHRRRIVLSGFVRGTGDDVAEAQAAFRTLMRALLDIYSPSRLPADLILEPLEDGGTATISARPLTFEPVERVVSEWVDLTITLESVQPEWVYEDAS